MITMIIVYFLGFNSYFFRNTNNDVCLLKLDGPLDLSNSTESSVAPIALNTNPDIELGPKFVVSGWGTTSVSF